MKKIRKLSLLFLTTGGILNSLIFGILIILINKINNQLFIYNIVYTILKYIALLVFQFSNITIYNKIIENPKFVGIVLIIIFSFLVLMYLIPNYLSNNNYKKFGIILSFILGTISFSLLSLIVYFTTKTLNINFSLNIFKLNNKFILWLALLFIGPILTLLGSFFSIFCFSKKQKIKLLNENQKKNLTKINNENNEVKINCLNSKKDTINNNEIISIEKIKLPINNKEIVTIDYLKYKIFLLKKKIKNNIFLYNKKKENFINEKDKNNNFFLNSKQKKYINLENKHLELQKKIEEKNDESPKRLFVEKKEFIKNNNYYSNILNKINLKSKKNLNLYNTIVAPNFKKQIPINNIKKISKQIYLEFKQNKKQIYNSKTQINNLYKDKFFFGDIDKIWTAGKKYREDILKKIINKNSFRDN